LVTEVQIMLETYVKKS